MHKDRQLARAYGDIKFIGKVCDRCGGNVRYVKSNTCVACQAVKNTAARRRTIGPTDFGHRVLVIGTPPALNK